MVSHLTSHPPYTHPAFAHVCRWLSASGGRRSSWTPSASSSARRCHSCSRSTSHASATRRRSSSRRGHAPHCSPSATRPSASCSGCAVTRVRARVTIQGGPLGGCARLAMDMCVLSLLSSRRRVETRPCSVDAPAARHHVAKLARPLRARPPRTCRVRVPYAAARACRGRGVRRLEQTPSAMMNSPDVADEGHQVLIRHLLLCRCVTSGVSTARPSRR